MKSVGSGLTAFWFLAKMKSLETAQAEEHCFNTKSRQLYDLSRLAIATDV